MTISDQELIIRAHPSTTSERKYLALYQSGTVVSFAAGHAEAARVIAREYGRRILDNDKLVSCRWER